VFPESKFWFACFTLPNGRRTKCSTKKTGRTEALKIAEKFEEAARNVATEVQARKVLSDIYALTTGRNLKSTSIEDFFSRWATAKQNELSASTGSKYVRTAKQFIVHLGEKSRQDLSHLEKDDVATFRDSILASRSSSTANLALKIIRIALGHAKREGLLAGNPAEQIKILKSNRTGMERRAFTLAELKRVLDVAEDEMRGLIIFGLYTGQRLGDLARLTWQNLDLQREELYCTTAKTQPRQIIPLAKPLMKYIESLPQVTNQRSLYSLSHSGSLKSSNVQEHSPTSFTKFWFRLGWCQHVAIKQLARGAAANGH
jgi:integrase